MKLIVDRMDLRPEHEDANCSQTRFEHFKPEIQQVITLAGKATFREFDDSNYNVVHAPETAVAELERFRQALLKINSLTLEWEQSKRHDPPWWNLGDTARAALGMKYPMRPIRVEDEQG